jgi:hypothetical protein
MTARKDHYRYHETQQLAQKTMMRIIRRKTGPLHSTLREKMDWYRQQGICIAAQVTRDASYDTTTHEVLISDPSQDRLSIEIIIQFTNLISKRSVIYTHNTIFITEAF